MSRERQKKQSDEVRNRILETAEQIIAKEGVNALSVRRITKEMDYSTGIIYHYFDNKEQILGCIMQKSYQKLLSLIQPTDSIPPDETLRLKLKSFIDGVLKEPEAYKVLTRLKCLNLHLS